MESYVSSRPEAPRGVILVVRMADREAARAACLGALRGGVDAVEITLSVPGALELIADLVADSAPGDRIGVGTVLDAASVKDAVMAGANFVVAPDTKAEVIRASLEAGVPVVPGALTPTEIEAAHRLGADAVKVFPVGVMGGPGYIKEVRGPLPHIPLVVSGGVTRAQIGEYFAAGALAACVGRDMFPAELLASRDVEGLAAHARQFMADVRG